MARDEWYKKARWIVQKKRDEWYKKARWIVQKKRDGWCGKSEMDSAEKARWMVRKKRDEWCRKSEMDGGERAVPKIQQSHVLYVPWLASLQEAKFIRSQDRP